MAHAHGNTCTVTLAGIVPYIATTTDHPRATGQHAVVLDEGFAVKVDRMSTRHVSNSGRVHAARLSAANAHCKIPLLTALPKGTGSSVVVLASAKLPSNVHTRVRFATGIVSNSALVESDRTSALLEMRLADTLMLFFEDGSVVKYRCDGRTLEKLPLTIAEMATWRIDLVKTKGQGALRAITQDAQLHELANIYQFAGKNDDVRDAVMEAIYELVERGWTLRSTVAQRLAELLRPYPIHFYGLNELTRGALAYRHVA